MCYSRKIGSYLLRLAGIGCRYLQQGKRRPKAARHKISVDGFDR
jgi:hypothetical protein